MLHRSHHGKQVTGCTCNLSTSGRLRQEDGDFRVSLGYTELEANWITQWDSVLSWKTNSGVGVSDKKLKVSISSLLPAVAPSPAALKITSEYENSEDKTGAHEFHPYMYVHVGPWALRVNGNTVIQVCLADTGVSEGRCLPSDLRHPGRPTVWGRSSTLSEPNWFGFFR